MIEIAFFCNPLHFGNLYNYSLDFIYTKSTSVVEFELGGLGGTFKIEQRVNTLASNPNLNAQVSQV